MVPMHMGHNEVISLRIARSVLGHNLLSEFAQSGAHVANDIFLLGGLDFHARGIPAVAMADRIVKLLIDKFPDRIVVVEAFARGFAQSFMNTPAYAFAVWRYR